MSDPESLHQAWLAKADNDVLNIENNIAAERVLWDTVCFHAQQATEKTLKAFLVFRRQPLQRTHNLVALLAACAALNPSLVDLEADCRDLTYFAVEGRYPEQLLEPGERRGRAMVAAMRRVRAHVLPLLQTSQDAT